MSARTTSALRTIFIAKMRAVRLCRTISTLPNAPSPSSESRSKSSMLASDRDDEDEEEEEDEDSEEAILCVFEAMASPPPPMPNTLAFPFPFPFPPRSLAVMSRPPAKCAEPMGAAPASPMGANNEDDKEDETRRGGDEDDEGDPVPDNEDDEDEDDEEDSMCVADLMPSVRGLPSDPFAVGELEYDDADEATRCARCGLVSDSGGACMPIAAADAEDSMGEDTGPLPPPRTEFCWSAEVSSESEEPPAATSARATDELEEDTGGGDDNDDDDGDGMTKGTALFGALPKLAVLYDRCRVTPPTTGFMPLLFTPFPPPLAMGGNPMLFKLGPLLAPPPKPLRFV